MKLNGATIERALRDSWITSECAVAFGVSEMTIYNWREKAGLPCIRIPGGGRHPVRFMIAEVKAWARATGRSLAPVRNR